MGDTDTDSGIIVEHKGDERHLQSSSQSLSQSDTTLKAVNDGSNEVAGGEEDEYLFEEKDSFEDEQLVACDSCDQPCFEDEGLQEIFANALSSSSRKFSKIRYLERPWDCYENTETSTETDFALFCTALAKFHEDMLDDNTDEWICAMNRLAPSLCFSIRRYADSCLECEVDELEERLADWVEFGLSEKMACRNGACGARHLAVGCLLARRIFSMRRRQFAKKLAQRHIIHRLLDVLSSTRLATAQRRDAARALSSSLLHISVIGSAMFNQLESSYSPYSRICKLLINAQDLPTELSVILHSVLEFSSFAFSLITIKDLVKNVFDGANDIPSEELKKNLARVKEFVMKRGWQANPYKRIFYRCLHESEILRSLCALASSQKHDNGVREASMKLLEEIVRFDGRDISGALFLGCSENRTAELVLKLLAIFEDLHKDNSNKESVYENVCRALKALALVDDLAHANHNNTLVVDSDERVSALLNIFVMCSVSHSKDTQALLAALSYSTNAEHLMEVFTFGRDTVSDHHMTEDAKARLRCSASYGYACEILLTLARLQSDGSFWRQYGAVICRLIDNNFISAASSLKQWTEPMRDPLAHGTSASSLHYLLQRLSVYNEKFMNGDSPLPVITTLRLIDALLSEQAKRSYASFSKPGDIRCDMFSIFYSEDGLQKVCSALKLATVECDTKERDKRALLTSDASIYGALLKAAFSVIWKVINSFVIVKKIVDVSAISILVQTYSQCCIGEAGPYSELKSIILTIFASYLVTDPQVGLSSTKESSLSILLKTLFESGTECPSSFVALTEILRELLPLVAMKNSVSPADARKKWNEILFELRDSLQFVITFGISSSKALRSSTISLCLQLARLSEDMALFISKTLVALSLLALSKSSSAVLQSVAALDSLSEDKTSSGEIRFGAAVDLTTASIFSFLAGCSEDSLLRGALVTVLSQDASFFSTALKFFDIASHKIAAHVCFQQQLIKLFKNLCIPSEEHRCITPQLPRTIYAQLCSNLATHVAQKEQGSDTVLLSLEALASIAESSAHGCCAVQNAIFSRKGFLADLLQRNELSNYPREKLWNLATSLATIFKNALANESVRRVVLKWPLSKEQPDEDSCEGHPLRCFVSLLKSQADFASHTGVTSVLEESFNLRKTTEADSDTVALDDCSWPSAGDLSVLVKAVLLSDFESSFVTTDSAYSVKSLDIAARFEPPMAQFDTNALSDEFLPANGADISTQNSLEPQPSTSFSRSHAARHGRLIQQDRTFGRIIRKRKRSFS